MAAGGGASSLVIAARGRGPSAAADRGRLFFPFSCYFVWFVVNPSGVPFALRCSCRCLGAVSQSLGSWLILSVSQASVLPAQSEFDIDHTPLYLFPMTAVTVSSKYQIVIPKEARQKLGISSGTRLQAIPEATGLRLVKEPSIDEVCGLLRGMPVDDAGIRSEQDRTLP